MGKHLMAHLSLCFFVACTELNAYMMIRFFFKTDDPFMDFQKNLPKEFINNSYANEKTCGSPKILKKEKDHTYWILQLPIILNTI